MKDRAALCMYYLAEKHCSLGKEGTLWKACVHCQKYQPVKGRKPIRKNLKKSKLFRIKQQDFE